MNKPRKVNLGSHRGNPRLWLEGKWLADFFSHGLHVAVEYGKGFVRITMAFEGEQATNKMTLRANGAAIIDINSAELRASLGDVRSVWVKPAKGGIRSLRIVSAE